MLCLSGFELYSRWVPLPKQKHVNVCGIQYEGSNSYCETHVSKIEAVSQTFACVKTSGT